jgi:NAD(P)-dependent dehydrogenase (short-subunit alcohol dehydrogenase family)
MSSVSTGFLGLTPEPIGSNRPMLQDVERTSFFSQQPIALIIGCGDMGMGCARALGRSRPLLVVDIDGERLEKAVAALNQEGYAAQGCRCDIADPASVEGLGGRLAAGPGVKVLAHVAAVGNAPGGWREVMRVDLLGAHLVAQAAAPHMVRGGVAILISSTGSYYCPRDPRIEALLDDPLAPDFHGRLVESFGREPDFLEAYFMAKQGVNRLAEALAIAWGPNEVRAVSVSPGLIDSTMGRTGGAVLPIYDGPGVPIRRGTRPEKARAEVPLGRQGSVLEVISVVEFVASDAASFLNGIDIAVDGGSRAVMRRRGVTQR